MSIGIGIYIEVVIVAAERERDEVQRVDIEARLEVSIVNVAVIVCRDVLKNLVVGVLEVAVGFAVTVGVAWSHIVISIVESGGELSCLSCEVGVGISGAFLIDGAADASEYATH